MSDSGECQTTNKKLFVIREWQDFPFCFMPGNSATRSSFIFLSETLTARTLDESDRRGAPFASVATSPKQAFILSSSCNVGLNSLSPSNSARQNRRSVVVCPKPQRSMDYHIHFAFFANTCAVLLTSACDLLQFLWFQLSFSALGMRMAKRYCWLGAVYWCWKSSQTNNGKADPLLPRSLVGQVEIFGESQNVLQTIKKKKIKRSVQVQQPFWFGIRTRI